MGSVDGRRGSPAHGPHVACAAAGSGGRPVDDLPPVVEGRHKLALVLGLIPITRPSSRGFKDGNYERLVEVES